MSSTSTPLTVLIAAADLNQSTALAEMVQSVRPGVRSLQFSSESGGSNHASSAISIAMVVEVAGPELGELSQRVRAAHPDVAIVLIAPRFDERAIEVAAGISAKAIVPSPCEPGALLRVLDEHERKVPFAGSCHSVATSELLRLHGAAASSGVLHLASAGGSGAIHLEDGHPIHAHTAENRGVDALRELLEWRDAKATWIAGRSASARTIVGRLDSLLERQVGERNGRDHFDDAPRDVVDKLERLALTPDILAAYLLRNTEVVTGRNTSNLDDVVIGRALSRLSQVHRAMEDEQGDGAGSEIQATIGEHRLVVDRLGPSRLGFQIGVVVRQATPVCKSLRRLLRQIDRSFRKSLVSGNNGASARPSEPGIPAIPRGELPGNLHRVA